MNTADLLNAAAKYNAKNSNLEYLALHITTSAKPTFESQLGFAVAYCRKTRSEQASILLAALSSACPPNLLPAVVDNSESSLVLSVAAIRSLENGFKISTKNIVSSLLDNGQMTDQLIQDIVSLEIHKASERYASPPFAISQAIANELLDALQKNPRLLLTNYRFIPILLSASGQAGYVLTRQISILHLTVDYTRLIDNLVQSGIPFDFAVVFNQYMQNPRNIVVLAKLAVLNQSTPDAANYLLLFLQNGQQINIGLCVYAFRILVSYDFSSNVELFKAVMNLSKLIEVFDHFFILIKDIAKNVGKNQQGYEYMRHFVAAMIYFAQAKYIGQKTVQLLSQAACAFSLHENLEIFGNSLETLSYIAHSKSCRIEEFCTCYCAWHKLIQTFGDQKSNLMTSLESLVACTRRIDLNDFEMSNYMVIAQKCMYTAALMDDHVRLKFLSNINNNFDEKHANAEIYKFFMRNLQDNYLENVIMAATLPNIDSYLNYIASLVSSDNIVKTVALLVQKVAVLLTLPRELQNTVIQLLSAFVVKFPDVLGEKTNAIFEILISQMLKNQFDQNLCFKIICAYYQVNSEAIVLFRQANFPIKFYIRFVSKFLTDYINHKELILYALVSENGKARYAAIDVVFKIVENYGDYRAFVGSSSDVSAVKFMTYYCFRLGELYNAGFEEALKAGKVLQIPGDFSEFGAMLLRDTQITQSVLTYIEVLFCNLDTFVISEFLGLFGSKLYEVALVPRFRFQIKRVFIAAGLCVGRDYLMELFAEYFNEMLAQVKDFETTHYYRKMQQKVFKVLRKVPPQSFPGRYEANTYISLNLPVPPKLRSQLKNTHYNDEEVNLKAGTTQEEIDEILVEKSDSEENIDEFLDQALHKEDQGAILESVKAELAQIRTRRNMQQSSIDFGDRYKNQKGGGDTTKNGKPLARVPLNGKVDIKDLRRLKRSEKIGDQKLRRAVQERVLKGKDAHSITSKKVQGGRKRIKAAFRHAAVQKASDRRKK